jgi:hypothetical protein
MDLAIKKIDCRAWAKAVCLQMPVVLLLTDRILTQVIVVLPTLSIEFSTAPKPADLPVERLSLEFFRVPSVPTLFSRRFHLLSFVTCAATWQSHDL